MQALKLLVAAFFGLLGFIIVVAGIRSGAGTQTNAVSTFVTTFQDWGLTPGIVLLCTAVILFFLPRKS